VQPLHYIDECLKKVFLQFNVGLKYAKPPVPHSFTSQKASPHQPEQVKVDRWCAVIRSKLKALTKPLQALSPSLSGQFNAIVKAWNHKQGEQGGGDGAPNDGHRHGPVKLAAFTDANGDRQHACNQCESGHDDGTQSFSTSRHQRFFAFNAF
jgi:hypothetical protein